MGKWSAARPGRLLGHHQRGPGQDHRSQSVGGAAGRHARAAGGRPGVDTSGSMRGEQDRPKTPGQAAAEAFARAMQPGTRLGLVAFSDTAAGRAATSPPITRRFDQPSARLDANGDTALNDAVVQASGLLARGARASATWSCCPTARTTDPVRSFLRRDHRGQEGEGDRLRRRLERHLASNRTSRPLEELAERHQADRRSRSTTRTPWWSSSRPSGRRWPPSTSSRWSCLRGLTSGST